MCDLHPPYTNYYSRGVSLITDTEGNGYVQRAFTISVDSQAFNDTEDLYTNFISKLITSNDQYKAALAGATVAVQGDYGVTSFGSSAPVAMSSTSTNGDIFSATTDGNGKFSLAITKAQQGETFKAKVITWIGLAITYPNKSTDSWCYMLFGEKDGINIGDAGSSVIFDTYTTELDTYDCSKVSASTLIIPTSGSNPGFIASAGSPSGITTTSSGGTTTSNPYAKVSQTWTIASPLGANESGTNAIQALSYVPADDALYLVKNQVTNTSSGSVYLPVVKLSGGFDAPQTTQADFVNNNTKVNSLAKESGSFIFSTGQGIDSIDSAWSTTPQSVAPCSPNGTSDNYGWNCKVFNTGNAVTTFSTPTGVSDVTNAGPTLCSLDLTKTNPLASCALEPGSNASHPTQEIVQLNGNIYTLSSASGAATTLNLFNSSLVDQKKAYVISKLDINAVDLASGHLFTDGMDLYFASLVSDKLTVRRLQLVEQ